MGKMGNERTEPYVKLDHQMLNSAAWTALSDNAVWLYIELCKQFDFKKGGYDYLVFPFSKVAWRMNSATYRKKTQELIKYGFIRYVQRGGIPKIPNVFALSNKWKEISREVVTKEGKGAIEDGLAKKPTVRDNLQNLKGKRIWEK